MKKILLILILPLLMISCSSNSPDDYKIVGNEKVDGYYILEKEQHGLFCNTHYQDVFYCGKDYNYGFSYVGCNPGMTFFIEDGGNYIYLQTAIEQDLISLDSLIPMMEKLPRHPEEISSKDADYYWLDFYVNHQSVYAYAGGECDEFKTETFTINGDDYTYSASGCLKDNILYIQIGNAYTPVSDLLASKDINGEYLIPLLTKVQ